MIVPNELLRRDIWVCHDQKVPYNPKTGRLADCTDSSTWTDYHTAERAMWRHGYEGLSFAVGNGLTAIDIDHCFDYKFSQQAQHILDSVRSYSEFSVGGAGAHVIARADIPAGRRTGDIEVYGSRRFMTFSGRHIDGTPFDVQPRQQEISELYNRLFPAMRPTNGIARMSGPTRTNDEVKQLASDNPRFNALFYEGDLSMWGGNASNADMALANILARYTNGNLDQMRELFKESAIYQMPGRAEKFERAWRDSSYGEITLRKALDRPQVGVGERSSMRMGR